ncbi:hypothetical protein ACP275_08G146800 [Erythranthe tilingii]
MKTLAEKNCKHHRKTETTTEPINLLFSNFAIPLSTIFSFSYSNFAIQIRGKLCKTFETKFLQSNRSPHLMPIFARKINKAQNLISDKNLLHFLLNPVID